LSLFIEIVSHFTDLGLVLGYAVLEVGGFVFEGFEVVLETLDLLVFGGLL
jgi:hypothetical protein